MPTDKKVIISSEDENVRDNKNCDAVEKDVVPAGDKNRFRGLFTKLPSLVRAVLMSRPFWYGLVVILVWTTCRHFKKRRSPNLLTRYIRRGKWLVDRAQKLITYKKANETRSRRQLQS
ncbi:hypothetical protein TSUD_358850 [Trifolium subterraneum]|uniref:Uncharacterized protein n=1 Tax=Trifolium subterraneum TaxID=3900 RepID=A0A2Z6MLC4_TRISU|nr:hypothetical protein TSUD_358850 [Trifolium subterraneum]